MSSSVARAKRLAGVSRSTQTLGVTTTSTAMASSTTTLISFVLALGLSTTGSAQQRLSEQAAFGWIGKPQTEVLVKIKELDLTCLSEPSVQLANCRTVHALDPRSTADRGYTFYFQSGQLTSVKRISAWFHGGAASSDVLKLLGGLLSARPGTVYETSYDELKEGDGSTLQRTRFWSPGRSIVLTQGLDLKDDQGRSIDSFVQIEELRW